MRRAPDALAEWDVDRLYLALLRGGAHGARRHASAQGSARDLAAGPDAQDADSRAPDWQGRLARALAGGRAAGRGLGLLAGRIGDAPAPRTPWEHVLRGLLARALSDAPRRSHARPAGRWLAMEAQARAVGGPAPVFEPGMLRCARRPRLAVGLDTSGSVPDDLLARFGAELAAIAARSGAETHLLAFDDAVHHASRLGPGDWAGRAARHADAPRRRDRFRGPAGAGRSAGPSLIVLTDLDGAFGDPPRGMPVLWAVPRPPPPRRPSGVFWSSAD